MPTLKYRTWATCLPYVSEYGFRNRKFLLVESGIPLTIKFRIQVQLTKNSEFSTWNPESTVWNPESKTILDSLTSGDDLHVTGSLDLQCYSLRASSPIWASEASVARTRVLARLAFLSQIGELARRLIMLYQEMHYFFIISLLILLRLGISRFDLASLCIA